MVTSTKLAKKCHIAKSSVRFFAFLPIIRCSSAAGASHSESSFPLSRPQGESFSAKVPFRCEHRCIILLWPREFCTEKVQGIYEPPTSLFPSQKEVLLAKVPLRCEHHSSFPLSPTEKIALVWSNCLIINRSQYRCLCHASDTAVPAWKNCSITWLVQQYHPTETAR